MQFTKNYSPTKSDLAFEEFRKNFDMILPRCRVTEDRMTYRWHEEDNGHNKEILDTATTLVDRLCLPILATIEQPFSWATEFMLVLTYMDNLQVDVPAKVFSLNNIYSPAKLIL